MGGSCFRRSALAGLVLAAAPALALNVGGPICTDTTWRAVDSPIVATLSVVVGGPPFCTPGTSPTLTIEPGVTVRFTVGKTLTIHGKLVARGTPEAPIRFTADVGPPTPSYWFGIRFEAGSADAMFDAGGTYVDGSILEHCVVEYLKDQGSSVGGIAATSSGPYLNDVTVQHGVFANSVVGFTAPPALRMRGVRIQSCSGRNGLVVSQAPSLTIDEAHVSGNTFSEFAVNVQGDVLALRNSTVANNTSAGLAVTVAQVTLSDVQVLENAVGGISIGQPGGVVTASLVRLTVEGNGYYAIGGAVYYGASVTIEQSSISDNQGDGVALTVVGTFTITNSAIEGNSGSGISAPTSSLNVTDNTIADNVGSGIVANVGSAIVSGNCLRGNGSVMEGAAAQFVSGTTVFQKNVVVGHGGEALSVGPASSVSITGNNIIHTGSYALRNRRSGETAAIDATNNWWGSVDTLTIFARIYDFFTDGSVGIVQFTPFATGPVSGAPDIATCLTPPVTTTTSTTVTTTTSSSTSTSSTSTSTSTSRTTTSTTSSSSSTRSTTTSSSSTSSTSTSSSSTTVTSSSTTPPTTLPTTSSTSTTSTSSTSSSTPSVTSTSSSSTSTHTATTASTITVTTTTSTSTTTTVPPCGNGIVEPDLGELCDPGAHGGRQCCSPRCQPFIGIFGFACGDAEPLGQCDEGDTCDVNGVCQRNHRGPEYECRFPREEGLCDLGDVCDGVNPDCPRTGLVEGCVIHRPEQTPRAPAVTAGCTTPRPFAGEGRPRCELQGFEPGASPAGSGGADVVCGRQPLTVVRTVVPRKRTGEQVSRTIKLSLTALGKRLLRQRGSLSVCVRTRIVVRNRIVREDTDIVVIQRAGH